MSKETELVATIIKDLEEIQSHYPAAFKMFARTKFITFYEKLSINLTSEEKKEIEVHFSIKEDEDDGLVVPVASDSSGVGDEP